MRPIDEVRNEVLAAVPLLPVVELDLAAARELALAEDVVATEAIPPFDNSAMDGYAVRGEDLAAVPVDLEVLADLAAGGVAEVKVGARQAVKIMTGAPMPAGADTVVKVEDTESSGDTVTVKVPTAAGTSVRPAGGDVEPGTVVLVAGTRLGPVEMAMLATVGATNPKVRRRPVASVMATGDELCPPDTPSLAPGQIRDSNSTVMANLLSELGVEVRNYGIVGDEPARFNQLLEAAAAVSDIIVTSGGVSMGDYDVVKKSGRGDIGFHQVAMQPGKPFAFGQVQGVPFFGLPGNPVSVVVSFEQFMRPALLQMMGSSRRFRPQIPAVAAEPLETNPEKLVFVRVAVTWEAGRATVVKSGGQSSNQLSALTAADAFALVPVGVGTVEAGEPVTLEMFRWAEDH